MLYWIRWLMDMSNVRLWRVWLLYSSPKHKCYKVELFLRQNHNELRWWTSLLTVINLGFHYVSCQLITASWTIIFNVVSFISEAKVCLQTNRSCFLNQRFHRTKGRSQYSRGLRRRSVGPRLLKLCVRIPQAAWISVCCECCVLSGSGLCDGLITRT